MYNPIALALLTIEVEAIPDMSTEDEIDVDDIKENFIKIEVTEIREPEDAHNERGNPHVEVTVHVFETVMEQYRFEFVHPKHQKGNVGFEKYRYGVPRITEGARESENRNEAAFKAAEALAEHTGTPVETLVLPIAEMADKWEYAEEKE